ncbi:MAG TPA: universal stress protein [Terracidiphilus sp.]|jgi:nucleotide-binding universal stress UspA family protein|nr:universal stress protein [Terracidiphilus sp.]
MAITLKPGWSKPSTILFATEIPPDEKTFAFALAQAGEFGADLILLHAFDTLIVTAENTEGVSYYDYDAAARIEKEHLEPLAERARAAGVHCELAVRPGLPADQILSFTREREVDRIVMGTRSPGPISKLLVGSVAEAVLRNATLPVFIVGPQVVEGSYRNFATRTILCAASLLESSAVVAAFAAEVAAQHEARLILQHVIRPQDRAELLAGHSLDDVEAQMLALVPEKQREGISVRTVVVPGDPTEELLYQSRVQQADLIVLGAQGASAFAAVTRHGVVYKVLAQATCPVLTLSPVVLAESAEKTEKAAEKSAAAEAYIAGAF